MTNFKINTPNIFVLCFLIASTFLLSCNKDTVDTTSGTVPDVFKNNFKSMVTLSATSTTVTLKSNGVPDHKSPYFQTSNALYEDQTAGQTVTPSKIISQNFAMTILINPVEAATKEETSLGPIGMALNGVAIFNDREGGNVPVDAGTLTTFDKGGGHSGPGGLYHYHFDGIYTSYDDAKLIGFLRDGFPIYGRKDMDGTYPTDLDINGGHVSVTADYPSGIYHYHSAKTSYMSSAFYILKSGSYHGAKGTFTF